MDLYHTLCRIGSEAYYKARMYHSYEYAKDVLHAVFAFGNINVYWAEIDAEYAQQLAERRVPQ